MKPSSVFLAVVEVCTICLVVLMIPCAKLPGADTTHWADALPMKQRHTAIRRIVFFMFLIFKLLMIGACVCFPQAA